MRSLRSVRRTKGTVFNLALEGRSKSFLHSQDPLRVTRKWMLNLRREPYFQLLLLSCPVPGRPHIGPVAVKLQSDFGIAFGHQKRLKRLRNGEISSAVHFLERTAKGQCAFRAQNASNVGRHNFVEANFVLERGTHRVRRHVQNLFPAQTTPRLSHSGSRSPYARNADFGIRI